MPKTVLVTGASGGIGAAIATAFAKNGHRVALGCHVHPQAAQQLCQNLNNTGYTTMAVQADITASAQVDEMFSTVESALGPVEILVNNAGIAQQKLFTDITDEDWAQMLAVNTTGAFYCCRRAVPAMVRAKQGCIINISSIWGQTGASCEVHYSAAKAALIGLTRALAQELAPSGVRVNCVAPGAISTPMLAPFSPAELDALCQDIPMGRLGTTGEVASAVLFLAGDGAAYITGQVLSPNGGMVI